MSIVLQSSGGGSVTVQEPATASNFTQTLPTATGTVMVSGNMPAFSVTGAGTACSNGVATLITNTTKTFDTNTCYNNTGSTVTLNGVSAPAYSFAPNVAGYYQFTATVFINGSAADRPAIFLYKNGTAFYAIYSLGIALSGGGSYQVSGLIQLNGTSDYVQVYYQQSSGTSQTSNGSLSYFCGEMIRN